jgi:hypothetical protein
MGLISSIDFIRNTGGDPRGPRLRAIDSGLLAYENADNHQNRMNAIIELDRALTEFKVAKAEKRETGYGGSKREGPEQNITKLIAQVDKESVIACECVLDLRVANNVCNQLTDVKIADVDFSEAVTKAAKKKKLGDGRTLYDTVKQDFDNAPVKKDQKVGGKWPTVVGLSDYKQRDDTAGLGTLQERQSEAYIEHEKSMTNAKHQAMNGVMSESGVKLIANTVLKSRFAVCESITATVIHRCKEGGFIVLAYRDEGNINDLESWGDHWFIVDMWYYNLSMRKQFLWASDQDRFPFYNEEVHRYKGGFGGLKIMARLNVP